MDQIQIQIHLSILHPASFPLLFADDVKFFFDQVS